MALYDAAKADEEKAPLVGTVQTLAEYANSVKPLQGRFKTCTDPKFQDDIASILEKEYEPLEQDSRLAVPIVITHSTMMRAAREERVKALIAAAGDGQNEKARPTLWKIIDKTQGNYLGRAAAEALGKIKKPEDLDRLIGMIEKNPRLGLSLSGFGDQMVVARISQELANPAITPDMKGRLSLELKGVSSHDNISLYLPLLESKDEKIAQKASYAINQNLKSGDDDVINQEFNSPYESVRRGTLVAVGTHAWDDKYVPLLINKLEHDGDDIRALAATFLGRHRVQSATPALQKALSDPNPRVREAAATALDRLSGKIKW